MAFSKEIRKKRELSEGVKKLVTLIVKMDNNFDKDKKENLLLGEIKAEDWKKVLNDCYQEEMGNYFKQKDNHLEEKFLFSNYFGKILEYFELAVIKIESSPLFEDCIYKMKLFHYLYYGKDDPKTLSFEKKYSVPKIVPKNNGRIGTIKF